MNLPRTLRHVVFDIGRVLVQFDVRLAIANLARARGRAESVVESALFGGERYRRFARGVVDGPGYHALFEEALVSMPAKEGEESLGAPIAYEVFRRGWCEMFWELPGAEALARDVAARYPVVLCSNTDPLHYAHLRDTVPALSLARGAALSYEVGAEKPDPRIFAVLVERFGVLPEATLFVDDRADNVEGARTLGFHAWHFGEAEPLHRALVEAGLL